MLKILQGNLVTFILTLVTHSSVLNLMLFQHDVLVHCEVL